jgi:hypothetical protein
MYGPTFMFYDRRKYGSPPGRKGGRGTSHRAQWVRRFWAQSQSGGRREIGLCLHTTTGSCYGRGGALPKREGFFQSLYIVYLHLARGNRLPLPVRVLDTPLACFISIVSTVWTVWTVEIWWTPPRFVLSHWDRLSHPTMTGPRHWLDIQSPSGRVRIHARTGLDPSPSWFLRLVTEGTGYMESIPDALDWMPPRQLEWSRGIHSRNGACTPADRSSPRAAWMSTVELAKLLSLTSDDTSFRPVSANWSSRNFRLLSSQSSLAAGPKLG